MKRVNIFWALLNSIFLIVFNVLFFMYIDIANARTVIWVSYAYIHFAYALLLITPYLVRKGKADYIYRRSLYGITTTYFLIQLFVGLVLIVNIHVRDLLTLDLSGIEFLPDQLKKMEQLSFGLKFPPTSASFAVILQTILAGIFLVILLINLIANEHTADRVEQREEQLKYVKQSTSQVKGILSQITDKQVAKKVERLYDVLSASQVKTNPGVRSLEEEVLNGINHLENIAEQNDLEQVDQLATKLTRLAEERNRKLRS